MLELLAHADEKKTKNMDLVNMFTHIHNTKSHDADDPNPAPFRALHTADYEPFDVAADTDLST